MIDLYIYLLTCTLSTIYYYYYYYCYDCLGDRLMGHSAMVRPLDWTNA